VNGWTYDAAGNLTGDGTTTYGFDALGRLTGNSSIGRTRNYAYNGDGVLAASVANGTSTRYKQDLAGGLSKVLATTSGGVTSSYLYDSGADRLAALTGGVRTWYSTDSQGSVRQTLSDVAAVLSAQNYDPYGNPESDTTPVTFGYIGEPNVFGSENWTHRGAHI
jgi:YD repeat-containing protein